MKLYSIFAIVFFTSMLFAQVHTDSLDMQRDYLWPTNASRLLSSSFAESRSGRFHAGIDFKTWGVTGYELYAVRDGYVSRISVSPFGYGRALYLTLDTGEIVVYGHTEKFNDEIEAYVKKEQKKRNSYKIQLYPKASQFPVKKGDLVGYSGDTGVGYPHLHFEMRDAASNPINPLSKGYDVKDTIAPKITKMLVQPLDAFSTVNRDFRPQLFYPVYMGNSHYHIQDNIYVSGRISFGFDAFDTMNDVTNKYGTYANELFIDGNSVFKAVYDKFSYSINSHFVFDRNYRQYAWGRGYIYNLFRDFENNLWFYDSKADYHGVIDFVTDTDLPISFNGKIEPCTLVPIPDAVKQLASGDHDLEIVCQDFWGNTSRLTAKLIVPESIFLDISQDSLMVGDWTAAMDLLDYDYVINDSDNVNLNAQFDITTSFYDNYARILLQTQDSDILTPMVSGWSYIGKNIKMPLIRKGRGAYVGSWPLSIQQNGPVALNISFYDKFGNQYTQDEWLNFTAIAKGKNASVQTDDGLCEIEFNSKSLYKNIFLRSKVDIDTKLNGHDVVGPMYKISPADVPMRGGCTISIQYPAGDSLYTKLGIYNRYKSRLVFMGNRIDEKSNTVSAHIGGFGTFCLAHDVEPPKIMALSPANGARFNHLSRLYATFKDSMSGISGEQNRVLKLDGKKVIAVYDPEKLLLSYEPDEPLTPGKHTVEIFLRDRCGNASSRVNEFWIK